MKQLQLELNNRLGIEFSSDEPMGHTGIITFRATELERPRGFSIILHFSWKRFSLEFAPDSFAGPLLETMGTASDEQRYTFLSVLRRLVDSLGVSIDLRINDTVVERTSTELPPSPWNSFKLRAEKTGLGKSDYTDNFGMVADILCAFVMLPVSLLPFAPQSEEIETIEFEKLPEGAREIIQVNRYERSPANRAACIAYYGVNCQACGFNFAEVYGEIGEGFIHVHHTTPVSKLGDDYLLDPISDLVPICANCHAMVHRREPPYSITELMNLLKSNNSRG
jgi:5-methylcytosine-specific restriction enzyme A